MSLSQHKHMDLTLLMFNLTLFGPASLCGIMQFFHFSNSFKRPSESSKEFEVSYAFFYIFKFKSYLWYLLYFLKPGQRSFQSIKCDGVLEPLQSEDFENKVLILRA